MDPTTMEEIELLNQLRENLADLELSEEDLSDKNLVRFLRARNANIGDAEQMIRKNKEWQIAEDVKSLLVDYEIPKGWETDFPYKMIGFDKTGCPVILAPFGTWDMQKEMALGNKEEFVKFIFHTMEKLWTVLKRLSKEGDHMKQVVGIVDLEGLTFRQVSSLDVVEAAVRCLKTFEANYPETVKAAVVVNAPWAFQIIWKIVKPFLSERTHAKLAFVGTDKEKWREAILQHAELDQFPEYYGGAAPDSRKYNIGRDGSCNLAENDEDGEADGDTNSNSISITDLN